MPQAVKKRKPCVKESQNGSVLALFVAVNRRRKSFRRKLHRSKNWTEWNNFVKNYETKLHSSEPDVIQDSAPQFLISFPNVDWFLIDYNVEVQLILFVKHFLFFPPGAADSTLKGTLPCTARLPSRLQEELTVHQAVGRAESSVCERARNKTKTMIRLRI